jgi:hypothetical protein
MVLSRAIFASPVASPEQLKQIVENREYAMRQAAHHS